MGELSLKGFRVVLAVVMAVSLSIPIHAFAFEESVGQTDNPAVQGIVDKAIDEQAAIDQEADSQDSSVQDKAEKADDQKVDATDEVKEADVQVAAAEKTAKDATSDKSEKQDAAAKSEAKSIVPQSSDACSIGTTNYASLAEAVTAAKKGDTITLLADIDLANSTIDIDKTVTLDMNDHKVSCTSGTAFKVVGGDLAVTGKGSVKVDWEAFRVDGLATSSSLSIGKDISVESANDCSIFIKGSGASADVSGSLVSRGDYATIQGNGNYGWNSVTLNPGSSVVSDTNEAIYMPGGDKLVIDGATVTGKTAALEIRAGSVEIKGGAKLVATAEETVVEPNGDGSTVSGAALAVAQHTTKLPVSVTISDATLSGATALYEANPQKNPAEDIAKVSLSVTGGTFTGKKAVSSEDCTGFISAGTFSSDVSDYVIAGYKTSLNSNTGLYEFQPISYAISYDLDGGVVAGTNPTSYTIESDPMAVTNPTKDKYVFTGWMVNGTTDKVLSYKTPKGATGAIALKASWGEASAPEVTTPKDVTVPEAAKQDAVESANTAFEAIVKDETAVGVSTESAAAVKGVVEAAPSGVEVAVAVTAEDKTEAQVSDDAAKITEILPSGAKSLNYLDLKVTMTVTDKADTTNKTEIPLTEVSNPIEFTVAVDKNLIADKVVGVAYVHEGTAVNLPASDIKVDFENGTVTFKGQKFSTYSVYAVDKTDLSGATFGAIADQTYTGEAITPAVVVTLGNKTLVEGTDYTVAYTDNFEVGTANVTITGIGNYKGTAKTTFKIVEAPAPSPKPNANTNPSPSAQPVAAKTTTLKTTSGTAKTGDVSPVALVFGIALLGAGAAVVARRKFDQER